MERTKKNSNQWENTRLPDAVNASPISDFTMVPNDILRNPEIGATAKMILCILLSNTDGWYSYKKTIMQMTKEGEHAITTGLKELECFDYLRRIKYRDKFTKQWRGSFWAYTTIPGEFNISHNIELMERKELEMFFETSSDIVEGNSETIDSSGDRATTWKPTYGKPAYGKPAYGKPSPKKTNNKNTNNKNINTNKEKKEKEKKEFLDEKTIQQVKVEKYERTNKPFLNVHEEIPDGVLTEDENKQRFDVMLDAFFSSSVWFETFCITNKISSNTAKPILRKYFVDEIQLKGNHNRTLKWVRSRFINWYNENYSEHKSFLKKQEAPLRR
jgi:hypothetical protein